MACIARHFGLWDHHPDARITIAIDTVNATRLMSEFMQGLVDSGIRLQEFKNAVSSINCYLFKKVVPDQLSTGCVAELEGG